MAGLLDVRVYRAALGNRVSPELWESFVRSDEVALLRERVTVARGIMSRALNAAGVEPTYFIRDEFSAPFKVPLPANVFEHLDRDYSIGATLDDGLVKGRIKFSTAARTFAVEFERRNPGHSGTYHETKFPVDSNIIDSAPFHYHDLLRMDILGVAAAAVFAKDWHAPIEADTAVRPSV